MSGKVRFLFPFLFPFFPFLSLQLSFQCLQKGTSFTIGNKKTTLQRQREEEEKKRVADEDAAKVYDEFVAAFATDAKDTGKGFVRGETINSAAAKKKDNVITTTPSKSNNHHGGSEDDMSARIYRPQKLQEALEQEAALKANPSAAATTASMEEQAGTAATAGTKKKKRDLDDFLEEIKRQESSPFPLLLLTNTCETT